MFPDVDSLLSGFGSDMLRRNSHKKIIRQMEIFNASAADEVSWMLSCDPVDV